MDFFIGVIFGVLIMSFIIYIITENQFNRIFQYYVIGEKKVSIGDVQKLSDEFRRVKNGNVNLK